jgi:serine/threonine protein kinase
VGVLTFERLAEILAVIENRKRLIRASQKCIGERDDSLTIYDFEVVKKLGEGQFGQVFLVKNINTGGGLFAVKCLNKKAIKDEQMELSVIEEKKILEKAIFPYIVGYVKAFHDNQNIFLLMEYLKGQEMFEVIR